MLSQWQLKWYGVAGRGGGGVGEAKNLNCLTHVGPDNRDIFHNGATP